MEKSNTSDGCMQSLPEVSLEAIDSPALMLAFMKKNDLVTIRPMAGEELSYLDLTTRRLATGESQWISKPIGGARYRMSIDLCCNPIFMNSRPSDYVRDLSPAAILNSRSLRQYLEAAHEPLGCVGELKQFAHAWRELDESSNKTMGWHADWSNSDVQGWSSSTMDESRRDHWWQRRYLALQVGAEMA